MMMPALYTTGLVLWVALYLGVVYQLLHSGRDADTRLAWLIFITFCMPVGVICYCLLGIRYRRREVYRRLHTASEELLDKELPAGQREALFPEVAEDSVVKEYRPLVKLLSSCGEWNMLQGGNSYEIITSGQRKRELLLEDIRNARDFIHIEYFRFGNDQSGREIRDALQQKAAEGVEVRFLNNNMIGRIIPRSYFRNMCKAGIQVLPYTHIRNGFRSWLMRLNCQNHRKIVVIDGKIGYTGGMNINDNYFYKWRDTHMRLEGPVVSRMQVSFADSWISSGGSFSHPLDYYFRLPEGPGCGRFKDKNVQIVTDEADFPWPTTLLGYDWILQNVKDYVYIQTPYFVPPDSLMDALKSAALRGVDVRVMMPRKVDTPFIGPANRAMYEECLEAGIKIYERSGEFIHSKTLVADDGVCIIGASNLDRRSFNINAEVNTFIYDKETALVCKEIFLTDQALAKEWSLEEWLEAHKWYSRIASGVMRLGHRML